jgi:putative membrane protein
LGGGGERLPNDRQSMPDSTIEPVDIYSRKAPDPALWTLYLIRALLTGPGLIFLLPYLYFRYHTLRYTFDGEGIHMRVGILFRREVNLTYARVQDIHLRSGLLQRWLGLADIQIQTASGSADAELVIEGFKQYEAIRDFLYTRMRGYHASGAARAVEAAAAPSDDPTREMISLLLTIRDELRRARETLQQQKETPPPGSLGPPPSSPDHV